MSPADLLVVGYDQTNTQGVADSVVKYLRRDHGYEVVVVGPGHGQELTDVPPDTLARARFFLELDSVSGNLHHTQALEKLDCPRLAWFVDSHKKPHFHQRIAPDFDLVFFTMAAWAGLFGERGRWLPVHYDEEWIGPRPGATPRYDVGFVGSLPLERTVALQEIARRHGLSLLLETTTGPREKEQTADLYAQCRIVFNRHVANDLNFRMVEAPACKRLLVTDAQRNGQYELFRDREHVAYYKDDEDLEAVLLHYLRNDQERDRVAAAGHALVSRLHTTRARVRELVAAGETLALARGRGTRAASRPPSVVDQTASAPPPGAAARPKVLLFATEFGADDAATWAGGLASAGADVLAVALRPSPARLEGVRTELVPGVPQHVATDPHVQRCFEATLLFDAALELVTSEPGVGLVVALCPEHAIAARELGPPYALVVASPPPESARSELEGAALVIATTSDLATAVARLAADSANHVVVAARPDERLFAALLGLARGERPAAPPPAPEAPAPSESEVRYDRDYMLRYGYCTRSPEEARLKAVQAGLIARVLEPRRALVAGCAAGELVVALLERGVDAWGFDAATGLETFVYPEVRDRVLPFDVTRVGDFPFGRAGGDFDTLVAIDLFEHVPESAVDGMLDGLRRFERLALVISSSPSFEGHICVKPFPWWLAKLEARGFELLEAPSQLLPREVGTYGVKRFQGVAEDMSEQLVFFRARAKLSDARGPVARPDVTIALVCCDRPDVLEETLETTRTSLVGSPLSVEWIAFDNGSGPAVQRVLADGALDLVLRAASNRGLAPALDALHREARGRYVLVLEDDWACRHPTHVWLDLAVAILDTQPDVGVVRLRRMNDDQCGHFDRHRPDVALRHHPWTVRPFPAHVVETREVLGQRFFVAGAEWANWTHNPTLVRREVKEWLGPASDYLRDPRDHRPGADHPGLEGAIDQRWRGGPWKVAKLLDGPFSHTGDRSARVVTS